MREILNAPHFFIIFVCELYGVPSIYQKSSNCVSVYTHSMPICHLSQLLIFRALLVRTHCVVYITMFIYSSRLSLHTLETDGVLLGGLFDC